MVGESRHEEMKKNTFSIIVICAVLVAVGAIMFLKFSNPKEQVVMPKKGEYTVVYVGGTLCKPCELLKPVFKQMQTDFASRASLISMILNNDNKTAYKIEMIPTILVFDKEANEVTRKIVSEEEVNDVPKWIDQELKKLESGK
jgi:thiol-disulfide isomerase/thioredoxin